LAEAAFGGAAGLATLGAAQSAASAAVPTIMAATGLIVPGVGTIHTVVTALTMKFAAASIAGPAGIAACAGGIAAAPYLAPHVSPIISTYVSPYVTPFYEHVMAKLRASL